MTWATADDTATVADNDYTPGTNTVTFAPGETSKDVVISLVGDTKVEADETFFVNLSNVSGNATITDGQGKGTIVNDDSGGSGLVGISINDVLAFEGGRYGTKQRAVHVAEAVHVDHRIGAAVQLAGHERHHAAPAADVEAAGACSEEIARVQRWVRARGATPPRRPAWPRTGSSRPARPPGPAAPPSLPPAG